MIPSGLMLAALAAASHLAAPKGTVGGRPKRRADTRAPLAHLTGLREAGVYNAIAAATKPRTGEESEGAA